MDNLLCELQKRQYPLTITFEKVQDEILVRYSSHCCRIKEKYYRPVFDDGSFSRPVPYREVDTTVFLIIQSCYSF